MAGTKKAGSVSFKFEDIYDSASRIDLVKIVQCANCLEIPMRPVYTCENGHVICSSCRTFSPRCGTCLCLATNTRNRVAENIIMTFVFKCKFRTEGCPSLVPWSDVLKHLSQCVYRPVVCTEGLREACNGKPIPYASYISHLNEYHHIRKIKASDHIPRSIYCDSTSQNSIWPLYVISFEDNAFLQYVILENSTMYIWLTHFGGECPDEPKFLASVEVKNKTQGLVIKAVLPVQTFRKPFEDIKKTGYFAAVQQDQLIALSNANTRDETSRKVFKYSWLIYTSIMSAKESQ